MEKWPEVLEDPESLDKIKKAHILMVGAGGIGCELLKTLVLTGFRNIDIVDMDTIETSNLNRQFLFRSSDVGKSKARVAAQEVIKLIDDEDVMIIPHENNIKDQKFGIDFFRSFNVVVNGLDNLEARRHVNRMCIACDVPLVESGTTGYIGQVTVHIKRMTHCYECEEKPTKKTYPICTIRNTPEEMIHCVVWAKELLFNRIFGLADEITDLDDPDMKQKDDKSFFIKDINESTEIFTNRIFEKVFIMDIEEIANNKDFWTVKTPPKPINSLQSYLYDFNEITNINDQHKVWSLKENCEAFVTATHDFFINRPSEVGSAVFDKDDDTAVRFVVAASNLRAHCYDIPMKSFFEIKGMAGNIIHAIATTNAIVAGLAVCECTKIVTECYDNLKESFICNLKNCHPKSSKLQLSIQSDGPLPPNPKCSICSRAQVDLKINMKEATLKDFVDIICKGRLNMEMPSVFIGNFIYEEGDDLEKDEKEEYEALLPKKLNYFFHSESNQGCVIRVQDIVTDLSIDIITHHKDIFDEEENPERFILEGYIEGQEEEVQLAKKKKLYKDSDIGTPKKKQNSMPKREKLVSIMSEEVFNGSSSIIAGSDIMLVDLTSIDSVERPSIASSSQSRRESMISEVSASENLEASNTNIRKNKLNRHNIGITTETATAVEAIVLNSDGEVVDDVKDFKISRQSTKRKRST